MTCALRAETVTVSAAISLKDALSELSKSFEKETGDKVVVNVGGSGQLMDQIRNGAPVDVFLSAGPGQVEELERGGRAVGGSRRVIARNRLVLVVPAGGAGGGAGFSDLTRETVKRIAVGKPKAVPAGDYAAEVFDHLGITAAVKGKLVYGANVRQVLDYVRRGEVQAGLVYATDARIAANEVTVAAIAPEDAHRPITYEGVVIKDATHAAAGAKFLNYLAGPEARQVLAGQGFEVEPKAK